MAPCGSQRHLEITDGPSPLRESGDRTASAGLAGARVAPDTDGAVLPMTTPAEVTGAPGVVPSVGVTWTVITWPLTVLVEERPELVAPGIGTPSANHW